jgi:pantoate--beta-alanine ligase
MTMPHTPAVARTLSALQRSLDNLRKRKNTVALVPTMGALHDGHISLVRLAKRRADKVVVSVFVNPTQFAPHEDYGSYPRTWKADAAKLAAEGVDLIWNPDAKLMYPEGFVTSVHLEGPATAGLEDRFRPHFFGGVATVVAKLLAQVRPDVAIFGEKDYQQLKVVTQMARDLNLGARIVGAPIMRERDGLAMSSRNLYLTPDQRKAAPALHRSMKDVVRRLRQGEDFATTLVAGAKLIGDAGFKLDYLEVRHAETLAPLTQVGSAPARLLAAATLGTTRLIDNMKI